MNPSIIYTILTIVIIGLCFIAWAINYERLEAKKTLRKKQREFDEGWGERTNQLVNAQRLLADEMNRAEQEAKNAKHHNERCSHLRAELTELELQVEENNKAAYELENAYAKSKHLIEKQQKQIEKLHKKIDSLNFKLKHPKKENGQFKPRYEYKEQTPKTEA